MLAHNTDKSSLSQSCYMDSGNTVPELLCFDISTLKHATGFCESGRLGCEPLAKKTICMHACIAYAALQSALAVTTYRASSKSNCDSKKTAPAGLAA